jgi:N-methylhydantoinase A
LGLAQAPEHVLALDMRFVGQGFEVSVDVEPTLLEVEDPATCIATMEHAFLATYERMYQQRVPAGRPIEITAMRVAAMITPASVPRLAEAPQPLARESTRRVLVDSVVAQTRFVPVDVLQLDQPIAGPLVIQSNTSSIVVPKGWTIRRDSHENLIMHRNLP